MWKGSIGFGMVNIPVKMYLATEESSISFSQLDKRDLGKVRYKKVNENTGKEIDQKDIVKGYEIDGQYVIVEDSDLDKAMPEKLDYLEILQFTKEEEINALYFEKGYYLEPEKMGAKAYALLRDSLILEGKVGLGLLVFHSKEWLCLLKPLNKLLVLHKLRFSDEIRTPAGLVIPEVSLNKEELKMASMLIAQLTKPFKPQEYTDTYAERLRAILEAKAKGKPAAKGMKVVHRATTEDLMDKLKASLKRSSKKAS